MVIASVLLLIAVWLASFQVMKASHLDPTWLMLALFGALVVARATVLAVGLDHPFPDEVFDIPAGYDNALFVGINASTLFLFGAWAGHWLTPRQVNVKPFAPFSSAERMPSNIHYTLTVIAGAASALLLGWVLIRSGGLSQAIINQKFERDASVSIRLRSIGTIAASIAVAYSLRADADRTRKLVALTLGILGAVTAFSWGARDGAVFPFLAAVLYRSHNTSDETPRTAGQRFFAQLGAAGLVVGLAVGLRVLRDLLARDELTATIDGVGPVRQVSVAANLVQFDAALLSFRDWGSRFPVRNPAELFNGLRTTAPFSSFLPAPEETATMNIRLAQTYVPDRVNGWPHLSIGEWWSLGGWPYVFIAGVIAGAIAVILKDTYQRTSSDPLQLMMVVIFTVVVFQFGFREGTPSRYLTRIVPLLLLQAGIHRLYLPPRGAVSFKRPSREKRPVGT